MATSPSSHGQNAVPVQLSPDPAFCIKSRVLPDGHKLFVNICHDSAIPSADGHVPVVLSERRDGADKAGQPCIIFDAIFNPDLCAKAAKDAELRQISLVRVEQATGFKLSRTIATPNIKSKDPIPPRTARIPAFWASRPSLVQAIDGPTTPAWTWSPTRDGCRIVINVPDLVRVSISACPSSLPQPVIILHSTPLPSHPLSNSQARHLPSCVGVRALSYTPSVTVTLKDPISHTRTPPLPIISHTSVNSSHTRLHVPSAPNFYRLRIPAYFFTRSLIGCCAPPCDLKPLWRLPTFNLRLLVPPAPYTRHIPAHDLNDDAR
ncbi:hypothetical protein FRC10_009547 [Ceratobasidium sp. 414]|nr:hypothetical protein FRC10_009547 [Ceratobasidium sp. 414]